LIFIEADNPDIGLFCLMPVGMVEVSSCQITAYEGQHVKKGDQLGMFHFGGSTHCLIFGPHVKLEFDMHGQTPGLHSDNIKLNEKIARVISNA
jgi:phosphatidylserine decarboxylase